MLKTLSALLLLTTIAGAQSTTFTITGFDAGSNGVGTIAISFYGNPNATYDAFFALKDSAGNIVHTISATFTTDSKGCFMYGPVQLQLAAGTYKLSGNIALQGTTPSHFPRTSFTVVL
jgi:hypothetical protein